VDPSDEVATAMQPRRFRSKLDTWLLVTLIAAVLMSAGAAFTLRGASSPDRWIAVPALLVGAGLPVWLLLGTHYTITDTELRVRSGPFGWRVPLAEIRSVTPTRNPLSSPALSLDRLRIDYGPGRALLVSPQDKGGFLACLEERRPGKG